VKSLAGSLRRELKLAGDPKRALGAQAYMKSEMPFYGVGAVPLRSICKRLFEEFPREEASEWRKAVLSLWREAKFREERYAAIELTGASRYKSFQTLDALPMYEEMIVSGAWWDYVDAIAANRIGRYLLRRYPRQLRAEMLRWSRGDNLWKRRTSIICQLTFRNETDLSLLYASIEPSLDSKEFFLRKAIGWALRQYARIDPEEVRKYVEKNEGRLSPLSGREAMKHIQTSEVSA